MWIIKKYINIFRNILKFIIYFFFFKIVIYSIFFLKLKKQNILYTNHFGFGDFLFFCVHIRKRINSNNNINFK
jgi:1-acyl-sn-glycerol-3-phosphate acyltransferase